MAYSGQLSSQHRLVKVMGGLGNQFFQYAFGKALDNAGFNVLYDTSWYEECDDHTGFELDALIEPGSILGSRELKLWKRFEKRQKLMSKLKLDRQWRAAYKEKQTEFDASALTGDALRYEGYWQSWKYLEACPKTNISDISALVKDRADLTQFRTEINQSDSIVLHIRRGDYFSNPVAAATHGVSLESYYKHSIDLLCAGRESDYRFLVFSDDPDPLQYFPSIKLTNVQLCTSSLSDAYTDLYSMSQAKNLVIANSTYSWWAAYLAGASCKVCAPDRWFKDREVALDSLFPPAWNIIASQ